MKKIAVLLLLLFVQTISATELFSLQLKENEKLEGSFSFTSNKKETVHLLFVKNSATKKYSIMPFLTNTDKTTKALDSFVTDEMPDIISNHTNGSVITISSYDEKNKKLTIIDFDTASGKNSSQAITKYNKPDVIFSQSDKTVLVSFEDGGKKLVSNSISNSNQVSKTEFTPSESQYKEFKAVAKNAPEAVNQNEFVQNGSISDSRAYFADNKLYFTNDKTDNQTQVFTFDLNNPKAIGMTSFDHNFPESAKDKNSYLFNDKLIAISSAKDDALLKSYDLKTGKTIKEMSTAKELNTFIDKNSIDKFLAEAKKSALKTTVTLNKTKDNKYKVRMDRVNKNEYTYYYNWWWHFHFMHQMQMQQMRMMQQQRMTAPRGFGPNTDFNANELFLAAKETYQSIEFVVDVNFNISKAEGTETEFKYIDKDAALKEFKENKKLKYFTSAFLDDELHYIYQDSKSKTIIIESKSL